MKASEHARFRAMGAKLYASVFLGLCFFMVSAWGGPSVAGAEPLQVSDRDAQEETASVHPVPFEAPEQARRVAVVLSFGTHFPVSIGGEVTLHLPGRVLLSVHTGFMPVSYVRAINGIAHSIGAYDDSVAELVSAAADRSFVWRASAGFEPFPRLGLELGLGYTYLTIGGRAGARELIEDATGVDLMGFAAEGRVRSRLRGVHAFIGYRTIIRDHLVLNVAFGWLHVLGSRTMIRPAGPLPGNARENARIESELRRAESTLDGLFRRWGFSPELRFTVGYRF